jgi:hypothetical protein
MQQMGSEARILALLCCSSSVFFGGGVHFPLLWEVVLLELVGAGGSRGHGVLRGWGCAACDAGG